MTTEEKEYRMKLREVAKKRNFYDQDGDMEEAGSYEGYNTGFVAGAMYQRKIDIKKAVEYFKTLNLSSPEWIDDFKKYMEG